MKRIKKRFYKNLIAGLAVVLPLAVTFWIFYLAFTFLSGRSIDLVNKILDAKKPKSSSVLLLNESKLSPMPIKVSKVKKIIEKYDDWRLQEHKPLIIFIVRSIFIILLFVIITFIGMLASWTIGRKLTHFLESLFVKIPIFSIIYNPVLQIIKMIFDNSEKNNVGFKKVVLIEYPNQNKYSIAFLAGVFSKKYSEVLRDKYGYPKDETFLGVFMPTTPNPINGFYIILPESKVKILNISIDTALKIILSSGAINIEDKDCESK